MSFLHLIFVLRLLLTFFSLLLFDFFFPKLCQTKKSDGGRSWIFLDDWEEKRNPKISYSKNRLISNGESTVNAVVDFSNPLVKISKYIFGNNLGHWSNRKILSNDDFIFNLKDISIPVIRFPGGNASNDYFWDASSVDQCPEGTPQIIYKSNFKKSTPLS